MALGSAVLAGHNLVCPILPSCVPGVAKSGMSPPSWADTRLRRLYGSAMKACVAVTDGGWAAYLRARPWLTEVNFWQPSPTRFRVLAPGQPFLFKSHADDGNKLIGGGFFSGWVEMPLSRAWAFFGEANGVGSLGDLRALVGGYRKATLAPSEDPAIGCIMLRDVYFTDLDELVDAPPDFAPNVVRYKGYDLARPEGLYIESAIDQMMHHQEPRPTGVPGPIWGDPVLVRPRAGQQAFKALVETAYHRRCAITGGKILPTLQAAHIRPISAAGENLTSNGLLLRADVHRMYDDGYLGIDARGRLHVSPRLRSEFGNGDEFYSRAGDVIDLPDSRPDRPDKDAVTWHMDTVFLAS